MKREIIVAVIVGAILGWLYSPVLGLIKMTPIVTIHLLNISVWLGELVESVVAIIIVTVLFGYLSGLIIKQWAPIAPLFGACGLLLSAFISIASVFSISDLGLGIVWYRFVEVIVASFSLFYVWTFIARKKPNNKLERDAQKDARRC